MKNFLIKLLFFGAFCCAFVDLEEIPNYFPICSRKVADLGQCIRDALYKLRPQLPSGKISPDFITPPLDPYVLSNFEIGDGRFLKATFYDIYIIGTTRFELTDLKAYFEGDYLKFMPFVSIDKLDIKCRYSITGFFPFPQTGVISLTFSDLKVRGNGRVHIYKKNGKEYFKIEQAKLMIDSIKVGNIKYSLPVGNVRSAGFLLNFLAKTIGEVFMKAAYKIFEDKIDRIHLDVANGFIEDVPVSYFFSE